MSKPLLRWAIPLFALFVAGPLAGLCTIGLRAADGSGAVTPILSASPVKGIAAGLAALAISAVVGLLGTRLCSFKTGLFSAGLTLCWAAWGTGNMDAVMRRTQSAGTLWQLSAEGAIFGFAALALVSLLLRVEAMRLAARNTMAQADAKPAASYILASSYDDPGQRRKDMALGFGLFVVVAVAVVWAVATEALKGQVLAAATIAAALGAAAGRSWAFRSPVFVFFVAVTALAIVSPAVATLWHGSESTLIRASLAGTLFPPARLVPLDWIAGSFVGVPLGLSLAGSMTETAPST